MVRPDGGALEYPDLRATVFPASVPPGLAEELPELYGTLLSTLDWFEVEDKVAPTGACVLEQPHHVVLFSVSGDTIEVLNKEFDIGPRSAERLCRALFRAFPGARRVHLEVLFPPHTFGLPKRYLYWTDHMIVDLPDSVDEYLASLGKRTRREVRSKRRRLEEAYPDTAIEILMSSDDPGEYVRELIAWKNLRFNARGEETAWQSIPNSDERLAELTRRRGQIRVTRIDGRVAALNFLFPVGTAVYALQSGFDPRYEDFSLGFLNTYENIADAIRTGHRRVSLLWGQEEHKRRFGAKPRRATRLSVFRRQTDRLYSLDEAWEVVRRELRRRGEREYWRARHAAGRQARRLGLLRRPASGDSPDGTSAQG
ncbi:MAG TPA: GNAT family N-acetyltransferase [Thermoleophilia bacterium]|nr:GNAT family N-acetyltransferase [Thermoleophilia bacterium]